MRIDQLEVRNFKGFEHKIINFSPQFNVLSGNNGSGKTAILDALAVGMGALLLGFGGLSARAIKENEVRMVYKTSSDRTHYHKHYPVEIHCLGTIADSKTISWKRTLNNEGGRTTRQNANEIAQYAEQLEKKTRANQSVILPLLGYYSRLWLQKKEKVGTVKPATITTGYVDCLEIASAGKVLMAWIKTLTLAEIQRKKQVDVLEGVKEAIKNSLKEEGCQSAYFDIESDELLVTLTQKQLPYHLLSDGQRTMLLMVADIAYRACELNSHLGKNARLETPGIVLIDEIDLHLHPNWQRRVVRNLRETFPKIQFIVTTHSPFIIQSINDGELIDLNESETTEYADQSIEDIAEYQMGVTIPQRSQRYIEMMAAAKEYYRVIEQAKATPSNEIEALKNRLDELSAPFSDNVAYHAFLEMQREAAGLGRKG